MSVKWTNIFQVMCLAIGSMVCAPAVSADDLVKGKIVASQIGTISSQITGERSIRVQKLLVREGDRVKKGDLLAQLSTEQLEADLSVANGGLQEAKAQVAVAKSVLVGAQLRFDRQAKLKNSASFRGAAFDDAEVALRVSENRVKSAQTSVARKKAEADRIELEIRLAKIVAPFDGIVADILTNVGAAVTQVKPNILTLLNLSRVEIEIAVPQNKVVNFAPGQQVYFSVNGGEKRPAEVRAILPQLSAEKQNRLVRLQLNTADLPQTVHDQQPVNVYFGES